MTEDHILDLALEHNFWTWTSQHRPDVIHVDRAEGVYFWDHDGKKYLDFNSTVMCVNIGHGNQYVRDAMTKQINELTFVGPHMISKPKGLLGAKLATITPPGLDHFLYTLGGSDANENAIKMARDYTGKVKILTRYRSYHGATMGAMALTGDRRRLHWEPAVMPGVVHFLDPFRYRSVFFKGRGLVPDSVYSQAYLDNLEEIIHFEGPHKIAAILLEPITGTNGIIIPPDGYLQGVREMCDHYNILMILDEVMTGFGRTGKMFACGHWGVVPDIITMAKGLTSGYAPLGAVAMNQKVFDHFKDRTFFGGMTYTGHPVSLAAAIANIEVIEKENLVQNSAERGETLKKLLLDLRQRHLCVGDVRSIGLFAAVELVKNGLTREPLSEPGAPLSPIMKKVKSALLESGLFMYNTFHMLLIIPPLIITDEQLREGIALIDKALDIADEAIRAGNI